MRKRLVSLVTSLFMVISMVCILPAVTVSAETYGDYEYEVLDDGTVEITYYEGSATSLLIPSTINGKKVTSIGDSAFNNCDSLTSITIPNSVTSIGPYAFYYCTGLSSITIPNSVTSIGDDAFYNCDSLTSITIPNSVTSIGNSAFRWCNSLTSITIPNSVTSIGDDAFYNCDSLTSITVDSNNKNYSSANGVLFNKNKTELIQYPIGNTRTSYSIPNTVTSIGDDAFYNCDSLTSITIPNSVTSIGLYAFYNCDSLTSITIPSSVTSIGGGAFYNTPWLENKQNQNPLVIVNGILIDGTTCSGDVTIPDSVTRIGNSAFFDCNCLTSITIPNSVTRIEDDAFYDCDSLTKITIPNSVTSIGNSAFRWCNSLTSITIPDSVTSIGKVAFTWCESLTSITVDSNNKYYSSSNGVLFNKNKTELIQYPIGNTRTSYTIPSSVTSIGDDAFAFCESLTSITIPDSVTSIGDSAFRWCKSLISVTIPDRFLEDYEAMGDIFYGTPWYEGDDNDDDDISYYGDWMYRILDDETVEISGYDGEDTSIDIPSTINGKSVTSIGDWAFSECTSLTSITIPNSVTSIGDSAFSECTSLTSITIPNSVTSIGDCAFSGCYDLEDVIIGKSVSEIGQYAFVDTNIEYVEIPESVEYIGERAFGFYTYYEDDYYDYSYYYVDDFYLGVYEDTEGQYYAEIFGIDYVLLDDSHTHSYTSKITKQPTCTTKGVRTYTCSCGDSYTESIAATGHKYVDTVVKPTYEAQGYTLHKCSVCGNEYKDNFKDPLSLGNVTGFKVTGSTASTISFAWNKVSDATGYIVYRKIDGKWNGVGTPTGTTYTDKNLTAGTTYNYRIRAYKKLSDGSKIYSGSFTTLDATTSLAAVTGFKVTGTTTNSVSLSWTAQNDATGYIVYRKIDGTWTGVGTPKISTYTDNNLTAATKYDYRIRAYKKLDDGSKIYSESFVNASATTANNTALANVTGFKVTGSTASTISFSWNKVSDATGYIVYRRINGTLTGVGTPTGNTFTDKNLGSNSKFEYAIRAYKKLSDGSKIYSASTTTLSAYTSLLTVSGFKVTESEAKSISLSWNAVKNVTGYIMYRKIDGKWTGIGTTSATTFTDTKDLYSGCTYEYAIRAYKKLDDGTKIYSENMKTLTTSTRPVSVTITVTAGTKQATVSWNKVSGATGYKVYFKDPSTGEWTLITTADKNTFSYTKTGLTSGKTYGLAVQSIRVVNGKTYSGKFVAKNVKVE